MFQRLVFTLATTASLIGLCVLYSVAMRPVIVIPTPLEQKIDEDEFVEAKRPAENVRIASTYIPKSKWAIESKYMLRAEQAFVYTEKWERDETNGKSVTFTPFAAVWVSTDKNGIEQATSIVSESAQVEFASTFDEKNPSPGRVVGAVLNGDVKIAGPDGLEVWGHTFFFSEAGLSLYTTNQVNFRFQSHRGVASQMRMKLIPAEGLPGLDRPHVYGVDTIRLIGGQNPVKLEMQLQQGKDVRPVNVRCATDLEYNVATNTAIFTNDVAVWTGPKNARDWLYCDTLTMQFVPKKIDSQEPVVDAIPRPQDGQPPGNDFQKIERNLEFSWLEAEGKRVTVHSEQYHVDARMTRLTYNADTQMLSMSSDKSGNDVTIVRNRSELSAPEIEAHLRFGEPNPLYSLYCLGQGALKYVDEKTQRLAFAADWKKQFSKTWDEETKLDLIVLDEQANFRQPDQMSGLAADLIKIWMVPMVFSLPSSTGEDDVDAKPPEPEPKRLLAEGHVAFKSPRMQIMGAKELDIRFDEEQQLEPTSALQKSRSRLQPAELTLSQNEERSNTLQSGGRTDPLRFQISNFKFDPSHSLREIGSTLWGGNGRVETHRPPFQTGSVSPTTRTKAKSPQVGFANIPAIADGALGPPVEIPSGISPEPFVILAERIGVRLRRVFGKPEPSAIHGEGKVTITQERQRGEKPMRLEGDHVDVQIESEKHEIVHVHGTPSLIRDRGFEIEGKNIHLDRGANRAWVSGAGVLHLPIPSDTKIPGMDGNIQRKLRVTWDESMDFNGLDAKFLGGVKATLGHGTMHCEQMVVKLAKRISFQAESVDSKPALHSVHCREKVTFENFSHLEKKVVDVYRGKVSEFTVNYTTGDVLAQGPGQIHSWQRQKKDDGIPARDMIQANRPIPVEVPVWDYTGVQFEGKLTGRFDGQVTGHPTYQRATIDDRVEVIHGPVKSTVDKIDADNLPSRAGTIRCGQLQFVNHLVSDRTEIEYRELVGHINAEIEGQVDGRRFTASADEISYDGSKGLYMLRAHGKQNARLTGLQSNSVIGRRIEFNPDPKLRILKVDRAVEGQGAP